MKEKLSLLNYESFNKSLKTLFTLVFIKNERKILLGLKTRGLGVGLWNGFGGKVEREESIPDCAKRELKEECNLEAVSLNHIGVVAYVYETKPVVDVVHIFTTHNVTGTPKGSEEMDPLDWYDFAKIPFENMWPDTSDWYPLMLKDKYFAAIVKKGLDNEIKEKEIVELQRSEEVQTCFL